MIRTVTALGFVLLLAACPDPVKNQPKAEVAPAAVGDAQPQLLTGGDVYTFSNNDSKLEWTGAKVTAKHDGVFQGFTGTIRLVGGMATKSQVKVDIQTASIDTTPERLLKHLKSADFFDVDTFPTATFVSSEIKEGGPEGNSHTVTGVLTLHGVAKTITFPATITTSPGEISVKAAFGINRKDFGIVYPGQPDNLIADDVLIRLEVHAKKQG